MDDCFICRKHRGAIPLPGGAIYEDDLFFVCHAYLPDKPEPVYLGWVVIELKRHVPELADLTDEESVLLGSLMNRLARALMALPNVEHVYSFLYGDGIPHFHLHLFPRYTGTPREFWGTRLDEWQDAPHGREAEIADLVADLRDQLASTAL